MLRVAATLIECASCSVIGKCILYAENDTYEFNTQYVLLLYEKLPTRMDYWKGSVFTALHFHCNLWMCIISWSFCSQQASPDECNVTDQLVRPIYKLRKKWSFENMSLGHFVQKTKTFKNSMKCIWLNNIEWINGENKTMNLLSASRFTKLQWRAPVTVWIIIQKIKIFIFDYFPQQCDEREVNDFNILLKTFCLTILNV